MLINDYEKPFLFAELSERDFELEIYGPLEV